MMMVGKGRLRTAWIAWAAWAVLGTAMTMEDIRAGSGSISLWLVAPFWAVWAAWPVIALWLRRRFGPAPDWAGSVPLGGREIDAMSMEGDLWLEAEAFATLRVPGRPFTQTDGRPFCRARDAQRAARKAGDAGLAEALGALLAAESAG